VIWILGFTNIHQSLTRRADGPVQDGKNWVLWYLIFLFCRASIFRPAANGQQPKDNHQSQNPPNQNQQKNVIMGDAYMKPFQEQRYNG
jgi:hypothetical protein